MSELSPQHHDITQILNLIESGDPTAGSLLMPLVYDELRRLAARRMANEAVGHTLQPTALVHEAFVRLLGHDEEVKWDSRGHFFAAAAEAMRRILVENARHKKTLKRNRGGVRIELKDEDAVVDPDDSDELLALDDALTRLASVDHELARLVELRYFSGLSIEETAKVLNISPSTTKRNWAYARAWLRREIDGEKNENS